MKEVVTVLAFDLGIDPILYDFLTKVVLSLMIGILIGIEREHHRQDQEVFAGVRTFAIVCICGMLATFVAQMIDIMILLITTVLIAVSCFFLIYRVYMISGKLGMTSSIALFLTYLLGVLVAMGHYLFAIIIGVIITFLLIEKKPLHSFAEHLTDEEIINGVQFLAVAFILYPLMPEEPVMGVLNLKSAILIVVLVMFIGFISYVSLKRFGTKGGMSYSGLFGGFVSSEATTAALAAMSKNQSSLIHALYIGILMSNISMIISNTLIALIVDPTGRTMLAMIPPQIAMLVIVLIIIAIRRESYDIMTEPLEIGSPFALKPAFKFGALFSILLVITSLAGEFAGSTGIYITALGGLVSSSAVVASVAALAFTGNVPYTVAAQTAVMAGIISTLNKIMLIRVSGSKELYYHSRNTFVLIAIVGTVVLYLWSYFDLAGL
ncbi:MgtC/SapB family protein [Methanococcoides seepicolus]|uniref:MgtC/SapB family protein n=1 Tax=Methanococcoides seepicolus TaxID=2828780 RepID=A0A9E4ZBZ4_9EURY|nr:MgtC/SapB family protein [Methanococcoides seepicolus]MCM1985462.1 MgtC/SapB family protein [Methanococcoides seepicolus]